MYIACILEQASIRPYSIECLHLMQIHACMYNLFPVKSEEPVSQLLPLGLSTVQHHAIPFGELGTLFALFYTVTSTQTSLVLKLWPAHV